MGRSPCCSDKGRLKKGPWSPEEDEILIDYIQKHGHGSWGALSKGSGLNRCGKSCRLRWTNYLRPDIKRGNFSQDEEQTIINLHSTLGNKWSQIAAHLPGRTDNEIKNFWNTHLRKKLFQMGIDPKTHKPIFDLNLLLNLSQSDATQLQFLQNLLQVISMSPLPNIEQNYPLGSNNLSPLDGLVNGTSTQYIIDAYKEETRFPSTRITSLPACFGGGFSPEVQNINIDNSLSTTIQRETRLPALVSTTSEISTMFETLEKFTDDEANSNLLNAIIIKRPRYPGPAFMHQTKSLLGPVRGITFSRPSPKTLPSFDPRMSGFTANPRDQLGQPLQKAGATCTSEKFKEVVDLHKKHRRIAFI